jgi:hypothetical protein
MILSSLKEVHVFQYHSILFIDLIGITMQNTIVIKGSLYILIHIEITLRLIVLGLNNVV